MGALHEPTEETRAQVFALSSFGVKQDDIADFLGMSDDTLRKHYSEELRKAKVERNAEVAAFLFRSANGSTSADGASYSDCLRAAMFWMKTQAGWRETAQVDHTSSDGSMTPQTIDLSKLSTEALAELVAARNAAPKD